MSRDRLERADEALDRHLDELEAEAVTLRWPWRWLALRRIDRARRRRAVRLARRMGLDPRIQP
jgi:hypothetical protein